MRPKITYSFIHSFKTRHKSDRPVRVQLAQRWQLLSAGCSTSDLRFHSTGLAATSPAEERQSLHRLLSLVQGSLPQFMRFHLVFACIFFYFFLPFFNPVLGFWNEPRYFVLFCRPEKISPSSTFAALCSAPLCSGVKSERQVESLLRSRCGHKTSTPGTSFSWQAGTAAGICIRSHPSLTVRTCWPHWPEGALLGTYAPFHCLPAL